MGIWTFRLPSKNRLRVSVNRALTACVGRKRAASIMTTEAAANLVALGGRVRTDPNVCLLKVLALACSAGVSPEEAKKIVGRLLNSVSGSPKGKDALLASLKDFGDLLDDLVNPD